MKMNRYLPAVLAALLLLCPAASRAQGLSFVFTNDTQSAAAGGTLAYAGTVSNTSGSTLFLTFDALSLTPASVATADDSVFFNNVTLPYLGGAPIALAQGASLLLPVFDVTIDPGASPGDLASGLFSIQADTSSDPGNPGTGFSTTDVPFTVIVTSAPLPPAAAAEPSTVGEMAIGGLGMIGMLLLRRSRPRRS